MIDINENSRIIGSLHRKVGNECGVRSLVIEVMHDMIKAARLRETLAICTKISIDHLQPDILAVKCGEGFDSPVCCVEVNLLSGNVMEDNRVIGRLFDHMMQRIVWFPDMEGAANSGTSDYISGNILHDTVENRHLCGTGVISYGDNNLPRMLVSMLIKAAHSHPSDLPLVGLRRAYMNASPSTSPSLIWTITQLESLSLQIPHEDFNHMIILRDYGGVADGRTLLAGSESGHLAVLKFIIPEKGVVDISAIALKECLKWNTILDVKDVRLMDMSGHSVIVMPFAFTSDPEGKVFKPLLSSYPSDDAGHLLVETESDIVEMLAKLKPSQLALEAIETMVSKGFIHKDVHWRHVGALPSLKMTADDARTEMRTKLGLNSVV
eukprot:gene4671-9262_t